jgi:hypothetical protein
MRRWPWIGGLLALFGGATIETPSAPPPERTERAAEREIGCGIEGDGFYVWDEDPDVAEGWVAELLGPPYPRRPS